MNKKTKAQPKPKTANKRPAPASGAGRNGNVPPAQHRFKAGNRAAVGHGRPKTQWELKDLIIEILGEGTKDGKTRMEAMVRKMIVGAPSSQKVILEYGFGKVKQEIDVNDLRGKKDSELITEIETILEDARTRAADGDSE